MCVIRWVASLVLLGAVGGYRVQGQGWEIDWDRVGQVGAQVASRLDEAGAIDQMNALLGAADIDWLETGKVIDRVLKSNSWEGVAEWLPEVRMLLKTLKDIPQAQPAADWLEQRMAYFEVANLYVQQAYQRRAAATKLPGPATGPATVDDPVHAVILDSDTLMWLARVPAEPKALAQRLLPSLEQAFVAEGVPAALVWLAEVESSFNPAAVSPAGAVGLFQFMPATAERFGLALAPADQRLDPIPSAGAAARYLKILYRQFEDWPLAIAAYNAGEGRVGRAVRQSGAREFSAVAEHLPVETQMYVPRVAAIIEKRAGQSLTTLPSPL